jgi:hypothetical protein
MDIGAAKRLLVTACEQLELPRLSVQLMLAAGTPELAVRGNGDAAVAVMEKQAALLLEELGIEATPPSPSPPPPTQASRRRRRKETTKKKKGRGTRPAGGRGSTAGRGRQQSRRTSTTSTVRTDDDSYYAAGSDAGSVSSGSVSGADMLDLSAVSTASASASWLEQSLGLAPASPSALVALLEEEQTSPIPTAADVAAAEAREQGAYARSLLAQLTTASPRAIGQASYGHDLEPAEQRRAGVMDKELERMRQQVKALRSVSSELAITVQIEQQHEHEEEEPAWPRSRSRSHPQPQPQPQQQPQQQAAAAGDAAGGGAGGSPSPSRVDRQQLVAEAQRIAAAVSAVGEAAGDYLINQQRQQQHGSTQDADGNGIEENGMGMDDHREMMSDHLPFSHEIRAARRILHEEKTKTTAAAATTPMTATTSSAERPAGAGAGAGTVTGEVVEEEQEELRDSEIVGDMAVLRAFYRYYVPPFGSNSGYDDARIRLIISSYHKVAMQRQEEEEEQEGQEGGGGRGGSEGGWSSWRDWMYSMIEEKHGVDPRSCLQQSSSSSSRHSNSRSHSRRSRIEPLELEVESDDYSDEEGVESVSASSSSPPAASSSSPAAPSGIRIPASTEAEAIAQLRQLATSMTDDLEQQEEQEQHEPEQEQEQEEEGAEEEGQGYNGVTASDVIGDLSPRAAAHLNEDDLLY